VAAAKTRRSLASLRDRPNRRAQRGLRVSRLPAREAGCRAGAVIAEVKASPSKGVLRAFRSGGIASSYEPAAPPP
jgi:indole-3-glycerol phosphate synthase